MTTSNANDTRGRQTPSSAPLFRFLICLILALAMGAYTGWADFNNDEPQSAVIFLLVFGFFLGAILPKYAWLWGMILGLSILAVYLIARNLGYQPVAPPEPGSYAALLALIPAMIGAYAGVLARKLYRIAVAPSRM